MNRGQAAKYKKVVVYRSSKIEFIPILKPFNLSTASALGVKLSNIKRWMLVSVKIRRKIKGSIMHKKVMMLEILTLLMIIVLGETPNNHIAST